ncbi:hypothetical protein AB3N60_15825 [Leptospira sp. WS39.C2]
MKLGIFIGVGILIIFSIICLSLIPKKRVVTKEYVIKKEITEVWNIIRDIPTQKEWRSDINDIKFISVENEIWQETNVNGIHTSFQTVRIEPPNLWVIKVVEPNYVQSNWSGQLQSTAEGTKLIFQESISVESYFYRLLSYIFFDIDKQMNTYLKDLVTALGETFDETKVRTTME